MDDNIFRQFTTPVLTLAFWLHQHLKQVEAVKVQVPAIPLALIGAAEIDGFGGGGLYRYIPRLIGWDREFWFILVGKQLPVEGEFHHFPEGYPVRTMNVKGGWEKHETIFIRGGLSAAFLFHPGFHSTSTLIPGTPRSQSTDLLQKGCILPLLKAGIPVGMASYDRRDGELDDAALKRYGMTAANPIPNPWKQHFGTVGLVDLPWADVLWDIKLKGTGCT